MTCEGRVIRRSEELRSCGVRDGSTVQLMSRMLGGGKHKDKKSKSEKKHAASPKRFEQKSAGRTEERQVSSDAGKRIRTM